MSLTELPTTPIFTYLEYNKETNCLEGYLDGESSPRTDIPADKETVQSLIELLTAYVEDWNQYHEEWE